MCADSWLDVRNVSDVIRGIAMMSENGKLAIDGANVQVGQCFLTQ
jgi:hypothetical protein